jgi:hypothetical protein
MARTPQALIARLMTEGLVIEEPGMTSMLSGATSAQQGQSLPFDADVSVVSVQDNDDLEDDSEGYTAQELKLAKRFIELVGSADRARELVDKVDDCEDCLQLIDDRESERRDLSQIEKMAGLLPDLPDLPMATRAVTDLSTLYNPSAVSGTL